MWIKVLIFCIVSIILLNFVIGCVETLNPISKEELFGVWSYEDEQKKVLTWYFFENNSMLSNFTAMGGNTLETWYNYEIKADNKLCFTEIGSNNTDEFCYDYDYIEDENILKIIQEENIAYFERII